MMMADSATLSKGGNIYYRAEIWCTEIKVFVISVLCALHEGTRGFQPFVDLGHFQPIVMRLRSSFSSTFFVFHVCELLLRL